MTELRAQPGEYVRACLKQGQSFLITKAGKPAACLLPPSDTTVINSDGTYIGGRPLTMGFPAASDLKDKRVVVTLTEDDAVEVREKMKADGWVCDNEGFWRKGEER